MRESFIAAIKANEDCYEILVSYLIMTGNFDGLSREEVFERWAKGIREGKPGALRAIENLLRVLVD